ncbi:hypothetical protein H7X65_02955, partial [Candidatus Parcubacteria bacterium]|nr:hypothetical protein [Candidatus Parcubacteria bacterium]
NGKIVNNASIYNSDTNTGVVGKVTLEKTNGKLILSIEAADPKMDLNIWLTNTSEVTSKTEYVDFGLLTKNPSIVQYVVDMKGGDISFAEYKHVLIVDAKSDYKVYAKVILK